MITDAEYEVPNPLELIKSNLGGNAVLGHGIATTWNGAPSVIPKSLVREGGIGNIHTLADTRICNGTGGVCNS